MDVIECPPEEDDEEDNSEDEDFLEKIGAKKSSNPEAAKEKERLRKVKDYRFFCCDSTMSKILEHSIKKTLDITQNLQINMAYFKESHAQVISTFILQ